MSNRIRKYKVQSSLFYDYFKIGIPRHFKLTVVLHAVLYKYPPPGSHTGRTSPRCVPAHGDGQDGEGVEVVSGQL